MDIMQSIVAREVFSLFGVSIKNSVVSTWIMMAMVIAGVVVLRKRAPIVLEMLIDFVQDLAAGFIPGSTAVYVPFLGALCVFIAAANLIGIVPMMYTPTRDLNTPVALALVVLCSVFAFAIRAKGVWGFIKSLVTPMLPLDLIGYFSRTTSLSLRLFGNIVGGEIVVAVLFALVPVGVPLIMVALGSITGILQAYVFTVLASSYIGTFLES
jgi:F-type H+-transporting ATPase subunit a